MYRTVTSRDSGLHLNEAINRIFELIKTYIKQNNLNISPESNNLLESIYIAQEKVIEDRPNIYAQYYNTPQEDSIANSCLIKYWDYEKNGNLRPENVSIKSGIYITLTCPQGHSYCLKPSNYKLTNIKKPSKCSQCMLSYCPGLIGFGDCKEHCDIYKHVLQNIKYIPKYTIRKSHYHSFTSDKEIKLKKVSCSEHLIENANILYENDIRQFYVKLSIEKDSMKSEEILNFFLLTKPVDQLELINHISNTYTSYPILLNKVKDALSGKIKKKVKGSGWRVYFNIPIVDELAPTKVINNIRFWGIQYFSFITLKIFDYPNVMDEFCKTVLDSYGNTGWDFCYLNLTDKIKRDFGSLSADFCKKLYFLINQMNKIDHHYLIEDCITTLKTALYSI